MRRKPSASHWVTKPALVAYSPSSLVFFCGTMITAVSSLKASGAFRDREPLVVDRILFGGQLAAVDGYRLQRELVAVEYQRRGLVGGIGIADDRQARAHECVVVADFDVELDRGNQERRRRVVLEMNGFRSGFAHGVPAFGGAFG